jgi:hypothetical protein
MHISVINKQNHKAKYPHYSVKRENGTPLTQNNASLTSKGKNS